MATGVWWHVSVEQEWGKKAMRMWQQTNSSPILSSRHVGFYHRYEIQLLDSIVLARLRYNLSMYLHYQILNPSGQDMVL